MSLELSGTTGVKGVAGSVAAPSIVGDDTNTGISFPAADTIKFSTGGVERMQITNSGVSGTGVGGKFASYAIIADQKNYNTAGGSSSTGAFYTRDLNTELTDPDGIVSISSNQFTLQAGSYLLRASCPGHKAQIHKNIIWNVTDSSVAVVGTSSYAYGANGGSTTRCFASGRTTISGAKVFEVRHRVGSGTAGDGLGVPSNYDLQPEIYTIVEIFKEA